MKTRHHRSLLGVILFGAAFLLSCRKSADVIPSGSSSSAESAVAVITSPAEIRKIARSITAIGRCEAMPELQAVLTPVIEGRVAQLCFKIGDKVQPGQAIIELDTTLAQADLAEKQAARDSLNSSLKALESRPRSEEQIAAKLAVEQADLAVQRADAQLKRLRPLRKQNEIPEAQVYEAEQSLKQAQLQKQTAEAQLKVLMLSPRQELIDEAKSKMRVADEAVRTAEIRIALHTIKAPIAGVLEHLACRIGQTVSVGTSLGEVTDPRQVLIVAWLPAKWRHAIELGKTAHVDLRSAAPDAKTMDDLRLSVTGRIAAIGPSADLQTGNIAIQIVVDNSNGKLLIGQTISVRISLESPLEAISVPVAAVHEEEEGPTLRVVRNGKAIVQHPNLGPSDMIWVAVSNTDLKPGELVIVTGGYNLPDGTSVQMRSADETQIGNGAGNTAALE
jgi:RND family efflux transporter MFP subunit